jgi:hypothetical protein
MDKSFDTKLNGMTDGNQVIKQIKSDRENNIWVSVKDKGLLGDDSANDATALNILITAIGSTPTDLYFPRGIYRLGTNVTIPNNINIIMACGAILQPQSGVTITGTNTLIEAGLYQWIDCSLSATPLAGTWNVKEVYPEWFGGKNDGSTDNATAISNCFSFLSNGGTIKCQDGRYKIINTNYYLNVENKTYILEGNGFNTILDLYDYNDTYLFYINQDSDGNKITSFPGNRRLTIKNMKITGENSTLASLARQNETGILVNNVELWHMHKGLYSYNYCDNTTLDTIFWMTPKTSGGYLFESTVPDGSGTGDNLIINNIYTYSSEANAMNIAKIRFCWGARLSNILNGYIQIEQSTDINIKDSHFEYTADKSAITIKNSIVNINGNRFQNNNKRPYVTPSSGYSPITINDVLTDKIPSIVTMRDNTFVRQPKLFPTTRPDDIALTQLHPASKVILDNNKTIVPDIGINNYHFGITMTASFDSSFNQKLKKNINLLNKRVTLLKENSVWRIKNSQNSSLFGVREVAQPTFTLAEYSTFGSNFNAVTYYYKIVVYTTGGRNGLASDEVSVIKSSANSTIQINLTSQPDSYALIYRGTSTGTYDKVCVVPIEADLVYLVDTGDYISGFNYIDPANVIPADATPNAYKSSLTGVMDISNSNLFATVSAMPTNSTYYALINDEIKITGHGNGNGYEYVSQSEGANPTWRLKTQKGINKGSTANRPSPSTIDIGVLYLDTTLDADGKPIWWNGTKWIDATGADA